MNYRRFAMTALLTTALAGCATAPAPQSLADVLAHNPSLSTLSGLVAKAGLTAALKASGPLTVFAPTNEAFQAVPAKTLEDLAKHPDQLKAVLAFHVLPTRILSADVRPGKVKSLQGSELALAKAGEFVTVEEAVVLQPDGAASNGVVHTVDRVLMPPKR